MDAFLPTPKNTLTQEIQYLTFLSDIKLIKRGIWFYFLLLIFEGALRKWFLPGLAGPLLIVRDPLALWLIVFAWQRKLLPVNFFLSMAIFIGTISISTALLAGHGNLLVALFGARILLIHFPLIFVIGAVFTFEDVVDIGKAMLWISIPMAILIALQFNSPQSAFVNWGVGADIEGGGFSGALGYFRPSGTFSFTNGTTAYFAFLSCYVIYFWLNPQINRILLIASTFALLIAIPLSISRSLFFQVGCTVVFAILAVSRKPKYLGKMVFALIGIISVLLTLNSITVFQTASEAFLARYDAADVNGTGVEGLLLDRFLGGLAGDLFKSTETPFWGYGIGMGSNVGSQLLVGDLQYLIAEGEWGRLVGELGAFLGISLIIVRVGLSIKLAFKSYSALLKGNFLPWMLLSYGAIILAQGPWAQPTSLGFTIVMVGLIIASLNQSPDRE